jgi:hypothetical protein
MGVYELELKMDPVQPASRMLTLVQDVGSLTAGNLCHLRSTHPNIQDRAKILCSTRFLAQQLRHHYLFA